MSLRLPGPRSLAAMVAGLVGWRRHALAASLGAGAALALPPIHAVPLLWIAFPGLLWLIDTADGRRRAFAAGWWFGFGFFSTGLYWIAHALLIEPEKFGWLIPFAVFGLGAGLGLFIGAVALMVRLSGARGVASAFALAAAWTVMEWLRAWLFTGFPWNLMATVWMPFEDVLQSASVIGAYGLGFVTVAVAGLPAALADGPRRPAMAAVAGGLAALLVIGVAGASRLAAGPSPLVPGVLLRLVQPAVDQRLKWAPGQRDRHLLDLVELSRQPGHEQVSHVIWPETAVPFFLDREPRRLALVAAAAPPEGLVITGAPRAEGGPPGTLRVWNSLEAVDGEGRVLGSYDKHHLVPFGEYQPLRGVLPIDKITPGATDFSPGASRVALDLPGLPPFSPLICYEVIFPSAVMDPGGRAEWLLNVTNDGWFGMSAGPHQHFAAARLRAVEEGVPVVRVANTGISAVIDPYGRVLASLGLGRRGVLDVALPRPMHQSTPYGRYGDILPLSLAILSFGLSFRRRR